MTGQRRATTWRLDIVPPPTLGEVLVESARRVLAEVFLRNGHKRRDWFRSGSIAMIFSDYFLVDSV